MVSLMVALSVGEIGLRLMRSPHFEDVARKLFCPDKILRRVMKPHATGVVNANVWDNVEIVANSEGYRDTEWSDKMSKTRVMLLGDSFGFGWGCHFENTLGRIIDRSEEFSVFNLSIPGDGFKDYYYKYLIYRDAIEPTITVILMYVNDLFYDEFVLNSSTLSSPQKISETVLSNGKYVPECIPWPKMQLGDYLKKKSLLYRRLTKIRSLGLRLDSEKRRREALKGSFSPDIRIMKRNSKDLDLALESLAFVLQTIKEAKKSLLLVYIPPRYAIDNEAFNELRAIFGSQMDSFDPDIVSAKIEALTQEIDVPYLDLGGVFKHYQEKLYFSTDYHLNEKGHAVAAEAIMESLNALEATVIP